MDKITQHAMCFKHTSFVDHLTSINLWCANVIAKHSLLSSIRNGRIDALNDISFVFLSPEKKNFQSRENDILNKMQNKQKNNIFPLEKIHDFYKNNKILRSMTLFYFSSSFCGCQKFVKYFRLNATCSKHLIWFHCHEASGNKK